MRSTMGAYEPTMNTTPTLPSDRQLADAARQGHDAAWNELVERHRPSLFSVLGARRRSARRAALESIERLRDDLVADVQGDVAVRAFRPKAIAAVTGGMYGPLVHRSDIDRSELLLAQAFGRLPEPWQTVLWHSYVEQLSSAEVSPLVGRATSDVTDLVATAERGLIDAYAIEVLEASDVDDETAAVIPLLSGFVRDALPPHEHRRVERRLAVRDRTPTVDEDELADDDAVAGSILAHEIVKMACSLPDVLPPAVAPGVTGLSITEHRERLGTDGRSFGTATLFANRSDRARRAIVVGSVAAVGLALVGVAYLAQQPFVANPLAGPTNETATSASPSPTTVSGEGPVDSAVDPTVPETTDLELRPGAGGQTNTIEVIVADGIRSVGLRATESPLRTSVSTSAPVFAGGTGTLDLAISNDSDIPVDASFELVLPRGIVLDGLASGDANCNDPDDDSPFCNVSIAAGATLDLSLRVGLESTVVGLLRVEGETLDEVFEAPIVATQDLIHNSVGRGGALVIGNTVMTCDDDAAAELDISCDDVRNGTGEIVNRWDVPMTFIGAAPGFNFSNGSSATLDIPADATVVHAELFWSGDLEERGVRVLAETENLVTLGTPGGEAVGIEAAELKFGEEDSSQYVGRADVTDLISRAGAGDYLIGNIASAEVQGSYGAWALVVVFDDDDMPRRHRVVTDPFDWVAPQAPFSYAVDMPVPAVSSASAHLDVVAFEGERGFTPERFTVGGVALGGENPFDSSIVGAREPAYDNNLGVDIDAYDLTIDTPDGTLGIDATSDRDGIRLAVLVLTVDLDQ